MSSTFAGYLIPLGITGITLAVLWRPIMRDIKDGHRFALMRRGLEHPYADRQWHQRFALQHGLFWLPCPGCGESFGGHESLGIPHPDPARTRSGEQQLLCPTCSLGLPPRPSA